MADAIARYKNGKSVLFYTWTPNWTVGALKLGKDVVWIEVPYSKTKATKVNNATKSSINLGFGADDIRPAANVDFLKKNPKVEKLLKSAIANWQQVNDERVDEESGLIVKEVFVDPGRMLKRIQPAPQGRAHRIRKRSNHITLKVDTMDTDTQTEESNSEE